MINVKDPHVHGLLKIMEGSSEKKLLVGYMIVTRVANPDPFGSGVFAWILIQFSNFFGSGSGFSPDSGTKKSADRSLKVIYQMKT